MPSRSQRRVDAAAHYTVTARHSGKVLEVQGGPTAVAEALGDKVVARLMTIPGVDALTAISIVAAVGDFHRFDNPGKLVSYRARTPRSAIVATARKLTVLAWHLAQP